MWTLEWKVYRHEPVLVWWQVGRVAKLAAHTVDGPAERAAVVFVGREGPGL